MKIVHIRPTDGKCQDCDTKAELRPYGKGGKFVCFKCAMKDEDEAKRQFNGLIGASDIAIIDTRRK